MNVLMSEDLLELYEKGKSRRYKDISRNPELIRDVFCKIVQQVCPSASVSGAAGWNRGMFN